MAQLSERNKLLAELGISPSLLKTWLAMDYDEATWRNENEYKQACSRAKRARDYVKAQIEAQRPKPRRPSPPPDTPPIISHRIGRGTNASTYGEKFG